MTRTSGQVFDRVIVIESTTDPIRSGRELIDQVLRPFGEAYPDLDFEYEYHTPVTREDFLVLLQRIAGQTAARGGRPVLHVEIHGIKGGGGLHLANDEQIHWDELSEPLRAINRASKNNLLVVLAVCWGDGLAQVLRHLSQPTPVFGLVGPSDEIRFAYFLRGFRAFYGELLTKGDGTQAVHDLNAEGAEPDSDVEYRLYLAEHTFCESFRRVYAKQLGSRRLRQELAEEQLTQLRTTPWGQALDVVRGRKSVKRVLNEKIETIFTRIRDHYLMLDLFPSERVRFRLRYEECLPADTEKVAQAPPGAANDRVQR